MTRIIKWSGLVFLGFLVGLLFAAILIITEPLPPAPEARTVTVEKTVPGPERTVEHTVPGPERTVAKPCEKTLPDTGGVAKP